MAQTTSPDNIPSPSLSDPYALTQDMANLADATQNALIKRANAYTGTTAQRTAFTSTAPVGTIWSDTNGNRDVWKKGASTWDPIVSERNEARGTVTFSVSASVGGYTQVTFPSGRFSTPPIVLVSKQRDAGAKFVPYVTNITATGCRVGVYAGDGTTSSFSMVLAWYASAV